MPQKSEETVHILEGKATLYKRSLTPHWQVRYIVSGCWERMTTKCTDLVEAKSKAVDIVTNAWFREQHNLPIVSKRVKAVAKLAIRRMEDLIKSGRGKSTYKTYIQAINNYMIPLLGNHNIDRITQAVITDFERKRIELMGRVPSASVLNNHNSALNRIFDEAVERGYMTKLQVPLLTNNGIQSNRRPDFTGAEYWRLILGMRRWVKQARQGYELKLRQLLFDYVLVLANTGIRAGTEAMNLKWSNIYFYEEKGKRYLAMMVKGKTVQHEVTCRFGAIRPLDRIRLRNPKWADMTFEEFLALQTDDYVFRLKGKSRKGEAVDKDLTTAFGRMFKRLLDSLGLLVDGRTAQERTLYSLRHTYATYALERDRLSVHQLARHMGTSVAMIEQHYSHIILRRQAHRITSM